MKTIEKLNYSAPAANIEAVDCHTIVCASLGEEAGYNQDQIIIGGELIDDEDLLLF